MGKSTLCPTFWSVPVRTESVMERSFLNSVDDRLKYLPGGRLWPLVARNSLNPVM